MIRVPREVLSKDKKYYVAVSMGVDSLAALFWMVNEGFDVTAIHFNHSLRDRNDDMQASFIRLCEMYRIPYITESVKCDPNENDCRKKRLEFFSRVAQGGVVVTAHHLNDWVESYLMNCFRGCPDKRPFEVETRFKDFNILHPFLLTKKLDFEQYLERNLLITMIVEDETNSVNKGSRRNWVRNDLIPILKEQEISLEKFAKRSVNEIYDEYIDSVL
jgi:tRNA(Ile)-lysidine synthetase-like protein